jgi:AraC family transcriptional regulator, regulatory protein of adaptative response / methylated-DNA-[protein]-cysteine methyltransferase
MKEASRQVMAIEAVTPAEVRSDCANLEIRYGVHSSPFGDCLLATTARGICELAFLDDGPPEEAIQALRARWPGADVAPEPASTQTLVDSVFHGTGERPLTVLLHGTTFQIQVWRALLEIPTGSTTTYGDLARSIGREGSARAVGGAVGDNRIGYLIPCHRVIRSTGAIGDYRWGTHRKRMMLAREATRAQPDVEDV